MSAIILGYLAMSYTFSGVVCYLASLKRSNQQFQFAQLPKQPELLGNLVVTFFWPLWFWKEIDRDNNSQTEAMYYPEVCYQSFLPENSNFQNRRMNRFARSSLTRTRIKIQVPKTYQAEPVISRLTSEYGLIFNITAAVLKDDRLSDGLFHLELNGTAEQIQKALDYLRQKEVKIWGKPNTEGDAW